MKLLIIDDDAAERALTIQALSQQFADLEAVEIAGPDAFAHSIVQADFDGVVTEFRLAWTDGLALFRQIRRNHAVLPVIMLTRYGDEMLAATAIKSGIADYIPKSHRHALGDAITASLCKPDLPPLFQDKNDSLLLGILRLKSDYTYAMRIGPDNKPVFEWMSPSFKHIINCRDSINDAAAPLDGTGLAIHPNDTDIIQYRFAQLRAGFENIAEYRVIGNDGGCYWLKDYALPIRDPAHADVIRIYGSIQDLTRERATEEQLRLMQCAIESSSNGIVISGLADTDYGIIYANNAFLNLTGYRLEEIRGQNCRILNKHDHNQAEIAQLRTALHEGCDAHVVLRNYRKDGSLFWNEIHISPIRNQNNVITHFVGVQKDVTERCEMQALLSRKEAKLRAIFNNVFDGIFIIDQQGLIESINPSIEKIFGYQAHELIGQNITLLLTDPEWNWHDAYLGRTNNDSDQNVICAGHETYGLRKNRSKFPMDLSIIEINVDSRHLFICTVHDVSKHKQAEDALRKLSSHLELAREEERARIAREIHDELGSLLTVLKMDLSWLNKQLPADWVKCLAKTVNMTEQVDDAIQTVRKIITDLRPSILDHLGLLAAIEWHLEKICQQTQMKCLLTMPEHPIDIDDKHSMAVFRIMQEALTNIIRHSMATVVIIKISVSRNNLQMYILDNGCGMTQAQINKHDHYGIKGMHERARYFGGELKLDGRPGQGVLLSLSMPIQAA